MIDQRSRAPQPITLPLSVLDSSVFNTPCEVRVALDNVAHALPVIVSRFSHVIRPITTHVSYVTTSSVIEFSWREFPSKRSNNCLAFGSLLMKEEVLREDLCSLDIVQFEKNSAQVF